MTSVCARRNCRSSANVPGAAAGGGVAAGGEDGRAARAGEDSQQDDGARCQFHADLRFMSISFDLTRAIYAKSARRPSEKGARTMPFSVMMPLKQARRRHVERGIPHGCSGRRELRRTEMRHLAGVPLLDGNVRAGRRREIDGRQGRRRVERHAVRVGHHRHRVGADLVGEVAVGGDAIGADDDEIHVAALHERAGHALGDHGRRHMIAHEFPGGEPGALQERPRFVGEDLRHFSAFGRRPNHAKRGAVPGRGEGARVAVRENTRRLGHDLRAEPSHRTTARDVFVVNRDRLALEPAGQFGGRLAGLRAGGKRPLHALDGPEQVHGRRPRGRHDVAVLRELHRELARPLRLAAFHAEREPHRRRHANRRRATNHHRLDRAGHLGHRFRVNVDLLTRQLALIDHHHRVRLPFNRREHPKRMTRGAL